MRTIIKNVLFSKNATCTLDYLKGVVSARSVRKLLSTYKGYCLEVVQANGVTTQSIEFNNKDLNKSTLATFASSGSVYVKTFFDQAGGNFNATQSNQSKRPRIVNSGSIETAGNKPSLSYLGSSSQSGLTTTVPVTSYPLTILCVVEVDTPTNGCFIKIGNDTTGLGVGVGGTIFDNTGQTLIALKENVAWCNSGTTIPDSKMSVIELSTDINNNMSIYLNGNQVATNSATQYNPASIYNIGGYLTSGSINRYGIYKISEDIVLNRQLMPKERALLVADMKGYYNIS